MGQFDHPNIIRLEGVVTRGRCQATAASPCRAPPAGVRALGPSPDHPALPYPPGSGPQMTWQGRGPEPGTPVETLRSLGPWVLAQLLAAHSGGGGDMFLIPPPVATSSPSPSPGQLAMIVTEYMENGSLDTFLRVRAPPLLSPGPGEGSSVWVVGDNVRPPDTPSSPELGPSRPGEGRARCGEGSSGSAHQTAFQPPIMWKSLCCTGPDALSCTQAKRGASVGTQGPSQLGGMAGGGGNP